MGDQEYLLGETSLITTGLLQTLALPHVVWIIKITIDGTNLSPPGCPFGRNGGNRYSA